MLPVSNSPGPHAIYQAFLAQPSLLRRPLDERITLFETPSFMNNETGPESFPQLKIGRMAEVCLKHYLDMNPAYDLTLEHAPVLHEKRTLGELDFVVYQKRLDAYLHIELACKFYLLDPALGEGLDGWIGPNRSDKLIEKLERLREHQFPLLYRSETQPLLSDHGLNAKGMLQALCLKGFLFLPATKKVITPSAVNPSAIVGIYHPRDQLNALLHGHEYAYIVPKTEWMLKPTFHEQWLSTHEAKVNVNLQLDQKRSCMLWLRGEAGSVHRTFVVWW